MTNRAKRFPLRLAVHAGAWLPLAWLLWAYLAHQLTANPIQDATRFTGRLAIIFLALTLACNPLNRFFGWRAVLGVQRTLGLYTFVIATIHLFMLVGLDYEFAFDLLRADLADKPYIFVGAATMLILAALALTSSKWWMKRLGKRWKALHRLIYVAVVLATVHYAWSQKGDWLALRGDVFWPIAYGLAAAVLLLARVPAVRRAVASLRNRKGVDERESVLAAGKTGD
jgi:sulfoxide reductase heme-binding subunit YedZ